MDTTGTCTGCGAALAGAGCCSTCGTRAGAPAPPASGAPAPPPPADGPAPPRAVTFPWGAAQPPPPRPSSGGPARGPGPGPGPGGRYCMRCGTALEGERFCRTCGTAAGTAAPPPPPPLVVAVPSQARTLAVGCIVAGAGLVVGPFLPWARITAPLVGTLTKSGIEGGDGWLSVAAGVVVAFAGWSLLGARPAASARILVILGALAAGGLALFEYADISNRFSDIRASLDTTPSVFGVSASDLVNVGYGAGLHLIAASAAAALVLGLCLPGRTTPPAPGMST